ARPTPDRAARLSFTKLYRPVSSLQKKTGTLAKTDKPTNIFNAGKMAWMERRADIAQVLRAALASGGRIGRTGVHGFVVALSSPCLLIAGLSAHIRRKAGDAGQRCDRRADGAPC